MNKSKSIKGITLVALIITIIVLLILAVVAIMAVNNKSIIEHAQNSSSKHIIGQEKENIKLAISEWQLIPRDQQPALVNFLKTKYGDGNVSLSGEIITITMPSGNKYQEENKLLSKTVTYTIDTNQSDVTVTINGENRNTITVQAGTKITWSVTKNKYKTQEGEFIIDSTQTDTVTLEPIPVDIIFEINPTPSDATVTINGQQTKSVTIRTGTQVSWSVSKSYYQSETGTFTAVVDDYTENVILKENEIQTLTVNPSSVTISGEMIRFEERANTGANSLTCATASNSGADGVATWTFNNFNNLDTTKKIKSISASFKVDGTWNPAMNATLKIGGTTYGTWSTSKYEGIAGTKYTINVTSLPTVTKIKSGITLESVIKKKFSGIASWYGATITIKYQNP